MKNQAAPAARAAHRVSAKTVGAIAFSVVAIAAIALAVFAYTAMAPAQASAGMETMTSEIASPQEQEAFIELGRAAEAEAEAGDVTTQQATAEEAQTSSQAQSSQNQTSQGAETAQPASSAGSDSATSSAGSAESAAPLDDQGLTPADDCRVTINYLEYANYDDPDASFDDSGRRILGERVLTGLHEGDALNAWNYVLPLPGHFFFDGWPQNLTVSRDPSKNVIDLIYMKLWNSEYTVNYYLMTGADLDADTWSEALAPEGVEFTKMGSETFTGHRFDELVNGDAYEYKLNDLYVIDTYPAQIRLGTDPDNNVINVLYTTEVATLPDDIEVPSDTTPKPDLPGDTTTDYDGIITTLPDDIFVGNDEAADDFLGSDIDRGELEITDEMAANPVSKQDAERMIEAYNTGLHNGELSQTGDNNMVLVWVLVGIAAVAAVAVIVAVVVRRRKAHENVE